jgi:restriction system protein
MARRNESLLYQLAKMPGWISAGLAIGAFLLLRYVIPLWPVGNPMVKGFLNAEPILAPFVAAVLLAAAAVSAFGQFLKGRMLDAQTGLDAIGNLPWRELEGLLSEAFRRKGFLVMGNPGDGPDGGVDSHLMKNGRLALVQCKTVWRDQAAAQIGADG